MAIARPTVRRPGSGQLEAVEVHDSVPRRNEVPLELWLRIVVGVELRDSSELEMRAKDQVDGGPGPLDFPTAVRRNLRLRR